MNGSKIQKAIEDLGSAAYLVMHGFKISGRQGKTFYFNIPLVEESAFNESVFEYPNSTYHDFSTAIMALKKLPHYHMPKSTSNPDEIKSSDDLGAAAYLSTHGFKVIGRKGRIFYFHIQSSDINSFNEAVFEYPNSPYHDFDAAIMALKKLPPYYMPDSTVVTST